MTRIEAEKALGVLQGKPVAELIRITANDIGTESGAIGLPSLYNQKEVRDWFADIAVRLRAIATLAELR